MGNSEFCAWLSGRDGDPRTLAGGAGANAKQGTELNTIHPGGPQRQMPAQHSAQNGPMPTAPQSWSGATRSPEGQLAADHWGANRAATGPVSQGAQFPSSWQMPADSSASFTPYSSNASRGGATPSSQWGGASFQQHAAPTSQGHFGAPTSQGHFGAAPSADWSQSRGRGFGNENNQGHYGSPNTPSYPSQAPPQSTGNLGQQGPYYAGGQGSHQHQSPSPYPASQGGFPMSQGPMSQGPSAYAPASHSGAGWGPQQQQQHHQQGAHQPQNAQVQNDVLGELAQGLNKLANFENAAVGVEKKKNAGMIGRNTQLMTLDQVAGPLQDMLALKRH